MARANGKGSSLLSTLSYGYDMIGLCRDRYEEKESGSHLNKLSTVKLKKKLNKSENPILNDDISIYSMMIYIVFTAIFFADIATLILPYFGKIGMVLWAISYIFFFMYAFKSFGHLVQQIWIKKHFITLLIVIIMIGIVLDHTTNPSRLWHETTQEIGCMLHQLSTADDWGFHKNCFLNGYPTQQYLLPSIPSLLWGRTLFALNFGGCLYFILGILIFSSALNRYLTHHFDNPDLLGAIILSFLPHFYQVQKLLFHYEQSIFPFSFMLIACGLFLQFLLFGFTHEIIGLIGLLCFYLINVYTTGLSCYGLVVVTILYLALTKKIPINKKIILFSIVVISIIFLIVSFSYRGKVSILDSTTFNFTNAIHDVLEACVYIVYPKDSIGFASPLLTFLLPMTIICAISFSFGRQAVFAGLWCIATMVFAVTSAGYVTYGIPYRLHRMIQIIPVVMILAIYILQHMELHCVKKGFVLFLCLLVIFFSGILYHNQSTLPDHIVKRYYYFSAWINMVLFDKYPREHKLNLFFDPNFRYLYPIAKDYLMYFLPNGEAHHPDHICYKLRNIPPLETVHNFLLFESEKKKYSCYQELSLNYISSLYTIDKVKIDLYEIIIPKIEE